uniref:Protein NODULATION SIGNALING PATHWAY 2 n=2 Tax=Lotus japonicus TaxID=34305 RepID=NSP2_LOTJA|nr:RecName: Full=Protein NODULATION SIGNALING PATHWAY 2; Short=LsNSP2; AltName: Full=Transcription initiator for nodulation [Lotus japonicus]ABG49438.1 nodulation signaling pathway 2 [Lotus japonicus]BAE72690.1 transcription initiator for nodulation [Lotus japonicus]BAE72691.1 transcription initiator for nodulation [Lotus japonicus]
MEMDIDCIHHLDFSGHSTLTNTPSSDNDNYGCSWNHWSPVVNWDAFTGNQDDFHHLIDSMIDDNNTGPAFSDHTASTTSEEEEEEEATTTTMTTTTTTTTTTPEAADDDFKGLRLVHLLMAGAEALTGANKNRELARVILVRLKELVSHTDGTNMERLAAYFTEALQGLLEGAGGAYNSSSKHHVIGGPHHEPQNDALAAFQLLQDMSPYVKFGHFTANQAIVEAVAHERRVHIVDYDIMEGVQWASLMQALASNPNGPHLRITALSRSGVGRRSMATVQETGRRLTAFATSLGQPFSFHHSRLESDETFRPAGLKLVRGEALVFNCMLNLPHLTYRSPNSVASFLTAAKALRPRLVTVVEEEVGSALGGFVERFMDSLHHFSAVFDSLEAGFPMQGRARALVERVFLGPRIVGSLARIYRTGGGGEERGSWREWLRAAGFSGVAVSSANHCQSNLLLGLFNDGYRVEELGSNKLVLHWKTRRLLSASLWTCSSESDCA